MWGPILAWVRKQIGQRTDTASSTGSVHAKLNYAIDNMVPRTVVASDTLRIAADTERSDGTGNYVMLKKIRVLNDGIIRTSFDLKSGSENTAKGRIYINEAEVGTERSQNHAAYVTFTEDIMVKKYDLVEVYAKSLTSSYTVYVKNFRIYYDFSTDMDIVLTD